MATLKEAVESGRRWKHRDWPRGMWVRGTTREDGTPVVLGVGCSLYASDFEIEPEHCGRTVRKGPPSTTYCMLPRGHVCACQDYAGHEPEPEKPREWLLHFAEQFQHIHAPDFAGCLGTGDYGKLIRVHDADACDRLHDGCRQNPI